MISVFIPDCLAWSPIAGGYQAETVCSLVYCVKVCIITPMNSTDIIRRLKAEGWKEVHVKGSHHKFKHPAKPGHVSVPHPKRDLPIGTVRNIYRQAGWPWP